MEVLRNNPHFFFILSKRAGEEEKIQTQNFWNNLEKTKNKPKSFGMLTNEEF